MRGPPDWGVSIIRHEIQNPKGWRESPASLKELFGFGVRVDNGGVFQPV